MKDFVIHFESDYMEGCHPKILEKIAQINFQKQVGYGQDDFCQSAKQKIKDSLGKFGKDAEVHFLVGGTQTNSTVISLPVCTATILVCFMCSPLKILGNTQRVRSLPAP